MVFKKNTLVFVVGLLLVLSCFAVIIIGMNYTLSKDYDNVEKKSIPVMNITLNDVDLEQVNSGSKDEKYKVTVSLGGDNDYQDVMLKGHGNFSWQDDKKSYTLKFQKKVDILNMGKVKKWVLVANSIDKSFLRNDLGLYVSRIITGSPIIGDYINLVINGIDLGLYYATKAVDIDKNLIHLTDANGVIVEYDGQYGGLEENKYKTYNDGILTVKDLVREEDSEKALLDFGEVFDKAGVLAMNGFFDELNEYLDIESFALYYLISEFTGNPDAFLTSFFMYKDGSNDRIHAGPGWDFDAAFGNRQWGNHDDDFYSPTSLLVFRNPVHSEGSKASRLIYDLIELPEFYELVCKIYRERLMGKEEEIVARIDQRVEEIRKNAQEDERIWGREGFDEEIDYLKKWINIRFKILDEMYGGRIIPVEKREY